jgi:hypothetical protein
LKEGFKLRGEKVAFTNFRGTIESYLDMAILGDQGCEDTEVQTFLIRKDEVDQDLLNETTNQHITLTKAL